jgi:HK97 gp10 family phage protein
MPVRFKLETKGLTDYMEQLKQLGGDLDAAAAEALDAGGEVLVDGMRRRAPKDTHNLERHIDKTPAQRDGNFHFILVGLVHADAETARYGTAQEYGTSSMAAHPYLRPTIDEDMKLARKRMKEAFQARIQRGGA